MFKPERMTKVEIIGLKKEQEKITKKLQDMGAIHLKKSSVAQNEENPPIAAIIHSAASNLEKIQEIKRVFEKKDGIISSIIGEKPEKVFLEGYTDRAFAHWSENIIDELYLKAKNCTKTLSSGAESKEKIRKEIEFLGHFREIHTDFFVTNPGKYTTAGYGVIDESDLEKAKELSKIDIADECGQKLYITFISLEKNMIALSKIVHVVSTTYKEMPLLSISNLGNDIEKISKDEKNAKKDIDYIKKNKNLLLAIEERWINIKDRVSTEKNFESTEKTFIVEGWIPSAKMKALQGIPDIDIYLKDADENDEETPVKLRHSFIVKPFELMTDWFALPKYGELDPTAFIAVAYPLFFGMIVADIAYGGIMLLISALLILKSSNESIKSLSKMIAICSVSAIFFGFLFGSAFGDFLGFESVFNPMKDPLTIMALALGIGFIHINLGIALGIISSIKKKAYLSIIDSLCWLLLESGIILMILAWKGFIVKKYIVLGTVFVVITFLNQARKGITGIIGIPGFLGSWVSYVRLMALAVATSWLAFVVNLFVAIASKISILLGAVAFLSGHTFLTVTNFMSAFVHSMRLHYVEFFGLFYEGGGKEYKPLKPSNKYHKINGEQ